MYFMATITINIKDKIADEFRDTVKSKHGVGKGKLGKAIEEALEKWIIENNQKKIAQRQNELLSKGLYDLKGWKFNRDEIYDRI